jgi:hypothetical protein
MDYPPCGRGDREPVIEKSGSEEKPKVQKTVICPQRRNRRFLDQLNKKILPPKLADWIRGAGKKPRMVARLTKETA